MLQIAVLCRLLLLLLFIVLYFFLILTSIVKIPTVKTCALSLICQPLRFVIIITLITTFTISRLIIDLKQPKTALNY